MRDQIATIGPIAAGGGALGLCCALPILPSLGVVGAMAGWSLQSWARPGSCWPLSGGHGRSGADYMTGPADDQEWPRP